MGGFSNGHRNWNPKTNGNSSTHLLSEPFPSDAVFLKGPTVGTGAPSSRFLSAPPLTSPSQQHLRLAICQSIAPGRSAKNEPKPKNRKQKGPRAPEAWDRRPRDSVPAGAPVPWGDIGQQPRRPHAERGVGGFRGGGRGPWGFPGSQDRQVGRSVWRAAAESH